MTFDQFKTRWAGFSDEQRGVVKAKAQWERMSLWGVLEEWWSDEDPVPPAQLSMQPATTSTQPENEEKP